jgi:hypothetical protein
VELIVHCTIVAKIPESRSTMHPQAEEYRAKAAHCEEQARDALTSQIREQFEQ